MRWSVLTNSVFHQLGTNTGCSKTSGPDSRGAIRNQKTRACIKDWDESSRKALHDKHNSHRLGQSNQKLFAAIAAMQKAATTHNQATQ